MQKQLSIIYKFLHANRRYNHTVQQAFYHNCITPYNKQEDKARSLLFQILNTQSQPKIDKVAQFWKTIHADKKSLASFSAFSRVIHAETSKGTGPYDKLFRALEKQQGWGPKTAALFIKAICHTHLGQHRQYQFWKDVPPLENNDKLRLPVDAVIIHLFKTMSKGRIKTFAAINKSLNEPGYGGASMMVWDDLWYWGFITQKGSGNIRRPGFNESKYWAMQFSDKREKEIIKIKKQADRFIKLVKAQ